MYVEACETLSRSSKFSKNMRCFVMFVIAVCILFLLKLKWPKNKEKSLMNNLEKLLMK